MLLDHICKHRQGHDFLSLNLIGLSQKENENSNC